MSSDLNFIFNSLNFRQLHLMQATFEIIPLYLGIYSLGKRIYFICILHQIPQDQPTICFVSYNHFEREHIK